jgi:hypothetical protein
MPIIPPNSKEKNNLDKTIDKSQGRGIDSAKYNVFPDASSPVTKGASIPFDPSDLPDPAFDTHDLEMFHQEAFSTDDPYATSNMSLLIDPRSDDYGDYSGPNLDDHLAFCSHDSGHMGLSESPADSAIGKTTEESEHHPYVEESECDNKKSTSDNQFGVVSAPRVKHVEYEVTQPQEDLPPSGVSFQIGKDTSIDSQPPSIYYQGTQKADQPIPQPRSSIGREEKSLSRHPSESSIPTVTLSGAERPCPPMPRPRSENNLLSMKGSQGLGTPPSSPSRKKPTIAPRMVRSRYNESATVLGNIQMANRNVSAEDESAAAATCVSQPLPQIHEIVTTIDDGATASTSHVTSMESNSSDNNVHSEAHTSLDSGSPHPSLESTPSMSNKPDPCSSTPPEKAHSAYSGEKKLVDVESSLDHDWVKVDMIVDKKDGKDGLSSLDTQPRPRERTTAFSTKSDKTAHAVSNKLQKPKPSRSTPRENIYVDIDNPIQTDIQRAKPCWYCTNLTTLEICDVCGNVQHRETTV